MRIDEITTKHYGANAIIRIIDIGGSYKETTRMFLVQKKIQLSLSPNIASRGSYIREFLGGKGKGIKCLH